MSERLVNVDRYTPILLPVDMRQSVSGDDLVQKLRQDIEELLFQAEKTDYASRET